MFGITTTAAAPPPPAPATAAATGGDRCSRPAEVVFLVDTSRSIYPLDFPHELSFVQQMIGQFDVSPNTTRVAVISFSNGVLLLLLLLVVVVVGVVMMVVVVVMMQEMVVVMLVVLSLLLFAMYAIAVAGGVEGDGGVSTLIVLGGSCDGGCG